MLEIAHFAAGIIGGIILLKTEIIHIPNLLKNDVVFLFASGLFAMLPDINKIIRNTLLDKLHSSIASNIFWLHEFIDRFPDTAIAAAIPIALAIIALFIYWKGLT